MTWLDDKRGSTEARHRRKVWMLTQFGDGAIAYCTWCKRWVSGSTMQVDCVRPIGSYRRDNIIPACLPCWMARGLRTVDEFLPLCENPAYAVIALKEAGFLDTEGRTMAFLTPTPVKESEANSNG